MGNQELFDRAGFGKQADLFWSSRLGAYLRERASEVYTTAIAELKICDPSDSKKILRLQGDIWKSEQFNVWLSEAILDGIKALDLIESGDSDDD